MHRLRIVIIAILIFVALPFPAHAQVEYCASFDFTQGYGGFVGGYGSSWVGGEGWRSAYVSNEEALYITSGELVMSLTSIELTWQIITFGGGTNQQTDVVQVGGENTIEQNSAQAPGIYLLSWSGSATPTGQLIIGLTASNVPGGDGLAYLRAMEACGPILPEDWNPVLISGFVGSNPWPDVTPWARATPTPWPTPEATLSFGVVDSDLGNVTDTAINMYHFANQQGGLDTLIFFLMTGLILILIFRVIRKLKEEA